VLSEMVRQQQLLLERMHHQFEQLLRRKYGRKSEKLDPDQLQLFDVAAGEASMPVPEALGKPATTSRPKGRQKLPARLPRQEIVHDLSPKRSPAPSVGPSVKRSAPGRVSNLRTYRHSCRCWSMCGRSIPARAVRCVLRSHCGCPS
jgi:hypothetical protein